MSRLKVVPRRNIRHWNPRIAISTPKIPWRDSKPLKYKFSHFICKLTSIASCDLACSSTSLFRVFGERAEERTDDVNKTGVNRSISKQRNWLFLLKFSSLDTHTLTENEFRQFAVELKTKRQLLTDYVTKVLIFLKKYFNKEEFESYSKHFVFNLSHTINITNAQLYRERVISWIKGLIRCK